MKELYRKAVKNAFIQKQIGGGQPVKEKYGWIPSWDLKSNARDRILSLGDAGGMAPFQNGASFSWILAHLNSLVDRILSRLSKNALGLPAYMLWLGSFPGPRIGNSANFVHGIEVVKYI